MGPQVQIKMRRRNGRPGSPRPASSDRLCCGSYQRRTRKGDATRRYTQSTHRIPTHPVPSPKYGQKKSAADIPDQGAEERQPTLPVVQGTPIHVPPEETPHDDPSDSREASEALVDDPHSTGRMKGPADRTKDTSHCIENVT